MNRSVLEDPVYGKVSIDHPLLRNLYESAAVQRLAHIYQGGVTAFIKPERNTTRLDHSVGVMTLLQRLGAGVEEQAAGLIHDVPHTAFSHVIDFVFPNHEHTYHEEQREAYIGQSDLPDLLARHGLDWRRVSDAERYSLLEQPLPALCADRLDYFLRDGLSLGWVTADEIRAFLHHLATHEGRIVVNDLDAARWLGRRFIAIDDAIWCSVQEVGWYAAMAQALKAAFDAGVLSKEDLWGADRPLMTRLRASKTAEVQHWLALLRLDVDFARVEAGGDLEALPKVRAVDPPVLLNGHLATLANLDPEFREYRETYIANKQGHWQLQPRPMHSPPASQHIS